MAQHMGEKPQVGQRIRQGGAIHAEIFHRYGAAEGLPQQQRTQSQQRKGQRSRGIESDHQFSQNNSSFQMGILAEFPRGPTRYGRISARQNRVCPCQSMVDRL